MVKYYYDAWGNTITEVLDQTAYTIASLNPFRYRSYYYDTETELYYLKSRYYDPKTCRFITIDDISYLDPDSVNGLNLYAYCANNPVMNVDPTGNFPWLIFAIIAAAIIVTGGIVGGLSAGIDGGSALKNTAKGFWSSKNIGGLIVGGIFAGYNIYKLFESIFTTPDYEKSRWILY